jgi:hypothetical protein
LLKPSKEQKPKTKMLTTISTMAESRKGGAKAGGGAGNGFQPLGLSDPVYKGIVRMGFRVRFDVV